MVTSPGRYGITIPFPGVTLADHREWFEELSDLGYTDVWTAETDTTDGLTPLALAAAWVPTLNLGVAIVPAFTRGPALLAQSIATMAEAAPGRFSFGLGASSSVIVEQWNGITYEHPYQRVHDTLRFLRAVMSGNKVTETYDTFGVNGYRLGRPPAVPPPILLAALRSGMLRLAGREADGVVLNWLAADDVPTVLREVAAGATMAGATMADRQVVARIFVVPDPDAEAARTVARRMITAYLNVGAYAEFHRWLGRGTLLGPMWDAWEKGDRAGALAAVPDEVVDVLVVHGTPEVCRTHVERYVAAGVTVPVLMVVPLPGTDLRETVRGLAPRG